MFGKGVAIMIGPIYTTCISRWHGIEMILKRAREGSAEGEMGFDFKTSF